VLFSARIFTYLSVCDIFIATYFGDNDHLLTVMCSSVYN